MINRKEEQGQDAISTIKKEVGDDAKIEWLPCDLGSLKEVKKVFTDLREREGRLDLVSHANLQASFMVRC
jgi:NAD(P)-dependent dehydrogenase (short-subunit alcohol dehydrogenase family)